jgi:hypothetical protein
MWIARARQFVKSHLRRCYRCKRFDARAIVTPEGGLPAWRVQPTAPFRHTGVDHFGPLRLYNGEKVWVLLLTCAVTRALHLEMVYGLSAEATARALVRFAARRGTPTLYISDNGTSFVFLKTLLQESPYAWKTIPQAAPW